MTVGPSPVAEVRPSLSTIILTKNEEHDLPHCLEALRGFGALVVVDSGSTDRTLDIARDFGAAIYEHEFTSFAQQRNWALKNCALDCQWVLFLDADEVVTPAFRKAISQSISHASEKTAGFYCCWKTMLNGRWLRRCDSFPKWQFRAIRRGAARFRDLGHGQKEDGVRGDIGYIVEPYLHHAFSKGWEAWWEKHNRYSSQEAAHRTWRPVSWEQIFARNPSVRNSALRPLLSRVPGWPLWRFLYMFIMKGGFLEGREAVQYCGAIAWYEFAIRLKMSELKRAAGLRRKAMSSSKSKINPSSVLESNSADQNS